VGLFTDSYLPRRSGVVRAVEAASRSLRHRGHRVSIIAPAYPGFTDADPDVLRLPSVLTRRHPDFPLAVPYSASHFRVLRGLRLDVVHTHSPFLLGAVGMWIARMQRCPVVFTYHTRYSEYAHYTPLVGDLARPFITAYATAYSNRCDVVLASVPPLKDLLRRDGIRVPIEVIPSVGVEPSDFARRSPGDTRVRFGIPAHAPLLVFVGRLAYEKGITLLLEAFAGLSDDVWLLLVGDGPQRSMLEARAVRLGVAPRVVFAGEQDHARVIEALFASDLFVFPSQTETLGLAVIEALAAGRAVAAVRSQVIAGIVRDGQTGVLVPAEPGAFAEAIRALLADPDRRASMAACGFEEAAAYNQDRITEKLIGLYETAIERRSMVLPQRSSMPH
jgi:glycosyltransferase involved in cell wall biosynthesis